MTRNRFGIVRAAAVTLAVALMVGLPAAAMAGQAGVALPAGGGEPGKVYVEEQKALKAKDIAGLKKVMSSARVKEMDDPKFKDMLGMIAEMMPTNVKITGGTQTGDKAVLNVTGMSGTEKQTGEVSMVKEASGWKVDKESWKN